VVCDVSRPLTYTAAEATSRPDVLIIESGEIELPGHVTLDCDIGLEKPIVYACLAETALLALEGRFESFTLSRNINYKKVKEIYQIAKKHGARLAEIRSPTGVITDQEIDLCREHALKKMKSGNGYGR
jgi:predicted amino acid dehydrogenase